MDIQSRHRFSGIIFFLIFTLFLWGLFFLVILQRSPGSQSPSTWAVVYALAISLSIYLLHTFITPRLKVFSRTSRILLQALVYAVGTLLGYMLVFLAESFYNIQGDVWTAEIISQFFRSISILVAVPFSQMNLEDAFPDRFKVTIIAFIIMLFVVAVVSVLISYIDTRWKEERHTNELQNARLKLLQTQMQPHFLFNTLNTIVSHVHKQPDVAEDLLIRLSRSLRFVFDSAESAQVPLTDELHFVENYLTLLGARYPGKLSWNISVDENLYGMFVPVMLLQPLVENAQQHAWLHKSRDLRIKILASVNNGFLHLSVIDNGVGFDLAQYKKFPPKGHALSNIAERLFLLYSRRDLLSVQSSVGQGCTVTIKLKI